MVMSTCLLPDCNHALAPGSDVNVGHTACTTGTHRSVTQPFLLSSFAKHSRDAI